MCVQNYALGGFAQNRTSYYKYTCVDIGQQLQVEKKKLNTHTHKSKHHSKKKTFKNFTLIPAPYIFKGGIAKELESVC